MTLSENRCAASTAYACNAHIHLLHCCGSAFVRSWTMRLDNVVREGRPSQPHLWVDLNQRVLVGLDVNRLDLARLQKVKVER